MTKRKQRQFCPWDGRGVRGGEERERLAQLGTAWHTLNQQRRSSLPGSAPTSKSTFQFVKPIAGSFSLPLTPVFAFGPGCLAGVSGGDMSPRWLVAASGGGALLLPGWRRGSQ